MAGDLNARHPALGSNTAYQIGRDLLDDLRYQTIRLIGPFLNYHLSPGPLTTSDHIPIILDISTNLILIPKASSYSFRRTDWGTLKNDPDL